MSSAASLLLRPGRGLERWSGLARRYGWSVMNSGVPVPLLPSPVPGPHLEPRDTRWWSRLPRGSGSPPWRVVLSPQTRMPRAGAVPQPFLIWVPWAGAPGTCLSAARADTGVGASGRRPWSTAVSVGSCGNFSGAPSCSGGFRSWGRGRCVDTPGPSPVVGIVGVGGSLVF